MEFVQRLCSGRAGQARSIANRDGIPPLPEAHLLGQGFPALSLLQMPQTDLFSFINSIQELLIGDFDLSQT
jgi:hypothetical protein